MAIATKEQNKALEIWAHRGLGANLFWIGSFNKARKHLKEVILGYDPQKHLQVAYLSGANLKLHCFLYDALIMEWLGYPSEAIRISREANDLAESENDPFNLATALFFYSLVILHTKRYLYNKETCRIGSKS